jgi:hypothetical protein
MAGLNVAAAAWRKEVPNWTRLDKLSRSPSGVGMVSLCDVESERIGRTGYSTGFGA